MLVAGVVAEYNPFHNGHRYQLEKARENGATHIVAVMSGASVQRGDTAVFSKYERARAAIQNGCDLVIELPTPFSCSNGEVFSRSAVSLLAGLGENVVDKIFFGCESCDISVLQKTADLSEKIQSCDTFKSLFSQGLSYPQAFSQSVSELYGDEYAEVLSMPNNVLAIEYLKAVKRLAPWIEAMPIKREGTNHDSTIINENFSSATNIRNFIWKRLEISGFVPYNYIGKPSFSENMDKGIMLKIMTACENDIYSLPDVNENIANRFFYARNYNPQNTADFMMKMKSKNITLARIRRMVLHLVLGVKREDITDVEYGRILAFNERGKEILAKAKNRTLAFDTSLKRLESISDTAKRVSVLEQNAVRFQDMCREGQTEFTNEYTRKIVIEK